jgi:hypothetical protein
MENIASQVKTALIQDSLSGESMIKKSIYFVSLLFLSACATSPIFQKSTNGSDGYSVQDLGRNDHFRITVKIPQENTTEKFIRNYGFRAVGEECLSRGFQFFDVAELDKTSIDGFCFKDSTRKSLAITFRADNLKESPSRFVVEDLNSKTNTQVKVNDEILLMDGKSLTSMAQIKSLVFSAVVNNKNALPLKLKRQNQEMTVNEPIADFKNGALGASDLEAVRSAVR